MAVKLRYLFAALFCLVPALAWAQLGPAPGNITTPQATDLVPLYGRGTSGPLFGQAGQLPFGGVNILGSPLPGYVITATSSTTAAWLPAYVYNVLSSQWGANTGTGGDDSAAINACLAFAVANGGGACFLPPPPSGHYNVCANPIYPPATLPTRTGLIGSGSGGYDLRVLPGCSGFPTTATNATTGRANPSSVVYDPVYAYGNPSDKSGGRFFIQSLRIDGYCIAQHDLFVEYDPGFWASGSVFRNAAAGGSNIQDGLLGSFGYQHRFDSSNVAENFNDPGHSCYSAPTDLPAYNLQTFATDSKYELVGINAELANYDNENGGANDYSGAHGWGYPTGNPAPPSGDGQAGGKPLVTLYARGATQAAYLEADSYQLYGVRQNPVPSSGMVQSATMSAGGTGGTPGYALLTGTTGTGTKATYYGYISAGGVLTGPLLVWKQGQYSVNPSNPDAVTGGGLSGASVAPTMASGSADGFGSLISGMITVNFGGSPASTVGGVSIGDGIFGMAVTGSQFANLTTAANCVVGDSAFNSGVVVQNNSNCPVFTDLTAPHVVASTSMTAPLFNAGSASALGVYNFPFNGTNQITAPGGSSAVIQVKVNANPIVNFLPGSTQFIAPFTQFGSPSTVPDHISSAQTTAPTVTSCGTGTVTANSTDTAGSVTATGATSCTVLFNASYAATPFCTVTDNTTAAALKAAPAGAGIVVTGLTTNDVFSYICIGQNGG